MKQSITICNTRWRVLDTAIHNVRLVRALIDSTTNFGDLHNQMARSAISVASNIAEAAGSTSLPNAMS